MINFISGNIFESDCEAWVNPVNCVGVMGKGLALEFKKRFPIMHEGYQYGCKSKMYRPGHPMWNKNIDSDFPKWIVNFPTKNHWRDQSELGWIELGLSILSKELDMISRKEDLDIEIKSIAIPAIDCGLGGLEWSPVKDLITVYLSNLDFIKIDVYVPENETPADFLGRLGDDAAKWAHEFRLHSMKLGYSDMDEGWLTGWFANAIEHSNDLRRWKKDH